MFAARDIAERVSMPQLLSELGFVVSRNHRCRCVLHDGRNPSSFAWTDGGKWHCFTQCGGGDRIALVMAARHCDFKTALSFLAALAGVDLDDSEKYRSELAQARRERRRRKEEDERRGAAERRVFLGARRNVLRLERLRRNAGCRLAELTGEWNFEQERFPGEVNAAWDALALVADEMPRAAAAYLAISFGNSETRRRFAMSPEERTAIVDAILEAGEVRDERNHAVSVVL